MSTSSSSVTGSRLATALHSCERWTIAISEVVFPQLESPGPVYLDLEDDVLEMLASAVIVRTEDLEKELSLYVRARLDLGAWDVFRRYTKDLWMLARAKTLDLPPVIAVLAVSSLAAERMSR